MHGALDHVLWVSLSLKSRKLTRYIVTIKLWIQLDNKVLLHDEPIVHQRPEVCNIKSDACCSVH